MIRKAMGNPNRLRKIVILVEGEVKIEEEDPIIVADEGMVTTKRDHTLVT